MQLHVSFPQYQQRTYTRPQQPQLELYNPPRVLQVQPQQQRLLNEGMGEAPELQTERRVRTEQRMWRK